MYQVKKWYILQIKYGTLSPHNFVDIILKTRHVFNIISTFFYGKLKNI